MRPNIMFKYRRNVHLKHTNSNAVQPCINLQAYTAKIKKRLKFENVNIRSAKFLVLRHYLSFYKVTAAFFLEEAFFQLSFLL